ncbi:SPFH domain-containing protein [Salana multivorans]|uniref:Regulator of protease activity HflC (Stomatin/prohibitin superfamily) n=1 Tax=Salana multivorans TaxID=120377 RepID=A0A3N2D6R6_9MICO|nr:SPFH domain-containing protein [Salana multivorans]ROR93077.1 regulator of protease activity HflC (stomatin/prohibitin superfamily) [Salana multivorans]ROR95469.1 SPFH domain-containing protein [Salana multivorans]
MFIVAIILAVIALIATAVFFIVKPRGNNYDFPTKRAAGIAAAVALVGSLLFVGFSTIYSQSVGQASVLVNAGGTVAGQNSEPGFATKAPWQTRSEWDLFSQSVTYAGDDKGAPSYTGGQVSGQQVTASVSGGAQSNFDFSAVYSLDGDHVEELYESYRSQERFTKQVIEPTILAVVRDVPSAYSPVQFRGEKRGEAQDTMLERLNSRLSQYGVTVSLVNLQNITFSDDVEASIKSVEVAQQKEAEAEANLRATEVSAQAQVVEAEAQAEANRVLTESLTPELLRLREIEAYGSGTVFVVPEGSTPFVQVAP